MAASSGQQQENEIALDRRRAKETEAGDGQPKVHNYFNFALRNSFLRVREKFRKKPLKLPQNSFETQASPILRHILTVFLILYGDFFFQNDVCLLPSKNAISRKPDKFKVKWRVLLSK